MHKDVTQPHVLPRRVFVPHEETDVLGETAVVSELLTIDQLPTVSFSVSRKLIDRLHGFEPDSGNRLSIDNLQEVATHIFDIPFDTLPHAVSSVFGREIAVEEIASLDGRPETSRPDAFIVDYNVTLKSGERSVFQVEITRTPVSTLEDNAPIIDLIKNSGEENIRELVEENRSIAQKEVRAAADALRMFNYLYRNRVKPEVLEQFEVLQAIGHGVTEHEGKFYAYSIREKINEKEFPALLVSNQTVEETPIYHFQVARSQSDGTQNREVANRTGLRAAVSAFEEGRRAEGLRQRRIEEKNALALKKGEPLTPKGTPEEESFRIWTTVLGDKRWQEYGTYYNRILTDLLKFNALLFTVSEGRVPAYSINGAQLKASVPHNAAPRFILSTVNELTPKLDKDGWKKAMREWKEMSQDTMQIFPPFIDIPEEMFDEALAWAEQQIIPGTEIPDNFWKKF